MNKYEFIVDKSQKLEDFLFDLGFKTSEVARILKNKDVKINGERATKDAVLLPRQEVLLFWDKPLKQKFEIVYEDDNVFVVNKFEGIEVTGQTGIEGLLKGSIAVHRLDRNTKGLVILAKNEDSEKQLLTAFKEGNVTKKYLCEVIGETDFDGRVMTAYLFKDAKKSRVYVYENQQKYTNKIQTKFTTLKNGTATSIVECELLTGKTHQIRAHLAFLGHAILGDGKYGREEDNKKFGEKYQKLHCFYLKFNNLGGRLSYLNDKEFILYPNWFIGNKV